MANLKNNKIKAILFIGLGDMDVDHIDLAKTYGFYTIATNMNPDALALKKCDYKIIVNGNDVNQIFTKIASIIYKIEIEEVYTGTELFLSRSIIMKILNIPSNSLISDYSGENKLIMKKILIDSGIKVPQYYEVSNIIELNNLIDSIGFPIVIKPPNSLSSQGVSIVEDKKKLNNAYKIAKEISGEEPVLVEDYIIGELHDANGFWINNNFYPCGIADKFSANPPYTYSDRSRCPTMLNKSNQKKVYDLLKESTKALGMINGPVKGDFILSNNNEFYVIELAPRFHGPVGTIFSFPEVYGKKPMDLYFKTKILNKIDYIDWNTKINYVVETRSINLSSGKIIKFDGIQELQSDSNILYINTKLKVGDKVKERTNNNDAHLRITFKSKNINDIENNWINIQSKLDIVISNSI